MGTVINIFKDKTLYSNLEQYNQDLIDIGNKYTYKSQDYHHDKTLSSYWFTPNIDRIRSLPLMRCHPLDDPLVSKNTNYNLLLFVPNYLPLFLINLLYTNKDICIEDFGCGSAWFSYYLSKCGYNNFSFWDNWYQCNENIFLDVVKKGNISYKLNEMKTNPTVVNNSGSPFTFITYGIDGEHDRDLSNLELVCFETNLNWKNKYAPIFLPKKGFRYLCEDKDNLSISYCREDKYNNFLEQIKPYAI